MPALPINFSGIYIEEREIEEINTHCIGFVYCANAEGTAEQLLKLAAASTCLRLFRIDVQLRPQGM